MRSCWKVLFAVFVRCPALRAVWTGRVAAGNNVLPFALASSVMYTFLYLTSSMSLYEFKLTMIVVSAWKYNMYVECVRLHAICYVHIYRTVPS